MIVSASGSEVSETHRLVPGREQPLGEPGEGRDPDLVRPLAEPRHRLLGPELRVDLGAELVVVACLRGCEGAVEFVHPASLADGSTAVLTPGI